MVATRTDWQEYTDSLKDANGKTHVSRHLPEVFSDMESAHWCCDVMQVPESGKIYSFNEGNYGSWAPHLKEYIDSLKDASKWEGKPYSSR